MARREGLLVAGAGVVEGVKLKKKSSSGLLTEVVEDDEVAEAGKGDVDELEEPNAEKSVNVCAGGACDAFAAGAFAFAFP